MIYHDMPPLNIIGLSIWAKSCSAPKAKEWLDKTTFRNLLKMGHLQTCRPLLKSIGFFSWQCALLCFCGKLKQPFYIKKATAESFRCHCFPSLDQPLNQWSCSFRNYICTHRGFIEPFMFWDLFWSGKLMAKNLRITTLVCLIIGP